MRYTWQCLLQTSCLLCVTQAFGQVEKATPAVLGKAVPEKAGTPQPDPKSALPAAPANPKVTVPALPGDPKADPKAAPGVPAPPKDDPETEIDKFIHQASEKVDAIPYVSAGIRQVVKVDDQQILSEGIYRKGPGYRTRFELKVGGPDMVSTRLAVSDGNIGYQYEQVLDTKLLHSLKMREVMQLFEQKDVPLPQKQFFMLKLPVFQPGEMLRGMLREVTFDKRSEAELGEKKVKVVVVEGRWKKTVVSMLAGNPAVSEAKDLAGNMPQYLRIYLDAGTSWPLRFEMFRRDKRAEYKPVFVLEFNDVVIGKEIPESEFQWVPPKDAVPADLTALLVAQLKTFKDKAGASPAPDTTGAGATTKIKLPDPPKKAETKQ